MSTLKNQRTFLSYEYCFSHFEINVIEGVSVMRKGVNVLKPLLLILVIYYEYTNNNRE